MRITNKMMSNSLLYNISGNKRRLNALDEQYSTGLKIQRPSDDPIIAVRALKLRTNLTELTQYTDKNIPDALSWMESTESALRTTSQIVTSLHTFCVQGANDTLNEDDRNSILENMAEYKQQILQEGNANYAGRYLFTGYKTDTSLVFGEDSHDLRYTITEPASFDDIRIEIKITGNLDINELTADNLDDYDFTSRAEERTIYRLRLSYNNLLSPDDPDNEGVAFLGIPELDEMGNYVYDDDGNMLFDDEYDSSSMEIFTSDMADAYMPEDDAIHFISDTGEVIFGEEFYKSHKDAKFMVQYAKTEFEKNELRPEHYFDCVVEDMKIEDEDERLESAIRYINEDQPISYEVNFNQTIKINVQGRDAFQHDCTREIDDIEKAISTVNEVNDKVAYISKLLEDRNLEEEQINQLNKALEILETELKLKDSMMRKTFERGLTEFENQEDVVNEALADIGTRYARLELTENRLKYQKTDFTDLLSSNEDADMVETIVNYNAMETIYNASLSAAATVAQATLLDYLR